MQTFIQHILHFIQHISLRLTHSPDLAAEVVLPLAPMRLTCSDIFNLIVFSYFGKEKEKKSADPFMLITMRNVKADKEQRFGVC